MRSELIAQEECAVRSSTKPARFGLKAGPSAGAFRASAFTLIEMLTVISIIGVLAGMILGGATLAKGRGTEARVRAELNSLVTAIEAYKAKYGFYPPDNIVQKEPVIVVNSVTNLLYYELVGTIYYPKDQEYQTPRRDETVPEETFRKYFRPEFVSGFVNSVESTGKQVDDAKKIKNFVGDLKAGQHGDLHLPPDPDFEVLTVSVRWPNKAKQAPVRGNPTLNPWRYVSTNPTNNPTSFDLWAEYVVGDRVMVMGNWSREAVYKGKLDTK